MSDLRELYQSVILDHGRHPRNHGEMPEANCQQEGFNPLCGDHLFLYAEKSNNHLKKISFTGKGCAISMASASLMTECLHNKSIIDAKKIFEDFHALITEGTTSDSLGKLAIFAGVREFPARVKCATLAWHTLLAMLSHESKVVSTEA
ncbi:MAG: SUF system NifU family Fe-S cluster assembly protein [Gammaproteobacteria bacterium]|nr:SUF system NifU family Fe-S cluster assembly protein [Gammaproteobacteria bacterium]